MTSTPPFTFEPLIPLLPEVNEESGTKDIEPPFSYLFSRPQREGSTTLPLFPAESTPRLTEHPSSKPSSTSLSDDAGSPFGEFVSVDPLQEGSRSFSPTTPRHTVNSQDRSNHLDSSFAWDSGHEGKFPFQGDPFIEDATARSKERGQRVLGELLDHEDDPLYFLRHEAPVKYRITEETKDEEQSYNATSKKGGLAASTAEPPWQADPTDDRDLLSSYQETYIAELGDGRGGRRLMVQEDSMHSLSDLQDSATSYTLNDTSPTSSTSYLNLTLPRRLTSFLSSSLPKRTALHSAAAESSAPDADTTHPPNEFPFETSADLPASFRDSTNPIRSEILQPSNTFSRKPFIPPTGAPGFLPDNMWRKQEFEFKLESKGSSTGFEHVTLVGRSESSIEVLSSSVADMLRPHLPALPRLARTWTLLYSTDQHGISIATFYDKVERAYGKGSCILAVRAEDNEDDSGDEQPQGAGGVSCFGAWIGDGIKQNEGSYYGSGESFLWKATYPDSSYNSTSMQVFKWTGKNDYVALCESQFISFGGGDGKHGLYIDSSFLRGSTEGCETFDNEALCSLHEGRRLGSGRKMFECVAVEVWVWFRIQLHHTLEDIVSSIRNRMSSLNTQQPSLQRRAPLFFCYECHSEMRPLMMPDPHCASCHSTFVEEINTDNSPEDDPRQFQEQVGPVGDEDAEFLLGGNQDHQDPLISLMNALMSSMGPPRSQSPSRIGSPLGAGSGGTTFHFGSRGRSGSITFTSMPRGSAVTNHSPPHRLGGLDTEEEFVEAGRDGPLHPLANILAILAGGRPRGSGQMGDYVLDQHALDEIVTRLMETSQGPRPVPAPEDMIGRLIRTNVPVDSPLLQKDCAICKDSFEPTESESIITLPCNPNLKYAHSFHDDCILPWIRQNGTCPVCRYQLVPQPDHPSSGGAPPEDRATDHETSGGTGVRRGIWDFLTGGRSSSTTGVGETPPRGDFSISSERRPGPDADPGSDLPGSWDTSEHLGG